MQTFAALAREYGVDETTIKAGKKSLRYRNPVEKGFYWYWISKYVRIRDYVLFGKCVSCGSPKTYEALQAGHYGAASNCGIELLFDLTNLHGECGRCNAFDEGHLIGYRRGLIERYGEKYVLELEERYAKRYQSNAKDWPTGVYATETQRVRKIVERLSTALQENDMAGAKKVLQSV